MGGARVGKGWNVVGVEGDRITEDGRLELGDAISEVAEFCPSLDS